jgi:hypothetical protein
MLPSAEALHLRRVRRNLSAELSEQDWEGNRKPGGGAAEAEERVAAGGTKSPKAVPEWGRDTKCGHSTEQHSHRRWAGRILSPAWLPLASPRYLATKTPSARRRGWPKGSGLPTRTRTKFARSERPPNGSQEWASSRGWESCSSLGVSWTGVERRRFGEK